MKSVKIKVSLIANLIAIVCLIFLGIITFIFVKDEVFNQVVKSESNYVRTAKILWRLLKQEIPQLLKAWLKIF